MPRPRRTTISPATRVVPGTTTRTACSRSTPLFTRHNKRFFERCDMSMAPMVLDWDQPTEAVKDAFVEFAPGRLCHDRHGPAQHGRIAAQAACVEGNARPGTDQRHVQLLEPAANGRRDVESHPATATGHRASISSASCGPSRATSSPPSSSCGTVIEKLMSRCWTPTTSSRCSGKKDKDRKG